MEKILDSLYSLSGEIYSILSGFGEFNEQLYYSRGKLFDKYEDAKEYANINGDSTVDEDFLPDCRSENVDEVLKILINKKLVLSIKKFYETKNSMDEFLLFLGFSINLYYIVGLYSFLGKPDISIILEKIEDIDVKNYAILINDYIYSLICELLEKQLTYLKIKDTNGFEKVVKENNSRVDAEKLIDYVEKSDIKYLPDICSLFNDPAYNNSKNSEDILEEMFTISSDYRFAWIYKCIEDNFVFYHSNGEKNNLYEYRKILGPELYLHILGLSPLDKGKFALVDENGVKTIKTIRPAIFSDFGIGIPKIECISKKDKFYYYASLSYNDNNEIPITFEKIRESTKKCLKINTPIDVEDNPLTYMGKLFETVEEQKSKLEKHNAELERLHKQRQNMMGHLAHSWGNECYPEIVKKVADELLKSGNNSLANRLFKAYNSENNLMGEIIYLQAAMDDEPRKLQEIFKDSFFISGAVRKENSIQTLINDTIEILVFGLINYDGTKEKRLICRNKLCIKHTLDYLANDYSKRFECNEKTSTFLEWFNENIFQVNVNVDETWKEINFGKTEYGKIVIKNILTELFTNVLYHGKDFCEINLESDTEKLYLTVKNNFSENVSGQMKGLTSMRELVAKLNYNTVVDESECIVSGEISDSLYQTKVTFDKTLMYVEEW